MITKRMAFGLFWICILVALLVSGCGSRTGEITGTITGAASGQPLANTQIILCQMSEDVSGCMMLPEPAAVSGADGAFTIESVAPGSYVLLYGMPGELKSSPADWDGIQVGSTTVELDENGKFVQTGEGKFWEEGWESVGAELTDAAGKTIYTDGYALSNKLGVSIMVVNRERAPLVVVRPGDTVEMDWQVLER
jgi:hypothetical protein